jgi:chaperonin GroEL
MSNRPYQAVVFQPETYQALQRGINLVVDAVSPTLGPLPRVVAVEYMMRRHVAPELLDSGAQIAQRIVELPDRDQDVGAMLIRDTLMRVQAQVGDGTATTAVLMKALVDGGVRYLASGGNAMMLRRHLDAGLALILEQLDQLVTYPRGEARLTELAQAICTDPPLAAMLGEIFDIIGEYGRLDIRASRARTLEREYVEGMYWKNGVASREMLADKIKLRTEMENVAVLVSDLKLEDPDTVVPLVAAAKGRAGKAAEYGGLLVVSYEISSSVLGLLLANSSDEFRIVAVKAPGATPSERGAALLDMVMLTGGHAFLTSAGHQTLADLKASDLGRARSAWATTVSFGIVGGKGNARALRSHIAELRSAYRAASDVETRQALQERIGKLMGGAARLHVGGITESAILARRELAERAAAAMRSAMVEGVLPGGGVAFLACRPALQAKVEASRDPDERAAYQILLDAMEAPLRRLAANAGHDPSVVMARIAAAADAAATESVSYGLAGYDVVAGEVVDMAAQGIVDPAAAQKTALQAAVRTASLALTTDVVIHHLRPPITSPLYPSYAERQRRAGRTP